jgi:hypothetical protein
MEREMNRHKNTSQHLCRLLTAASLFWAAGSTWSFVHPDSLSQTGTYNPAIPTPESVIGFSIGEKPVRPALITDYLKALDNASPRTRLIELGETWEKRPLHILFISASPHIRHLEAIREQLARLADPRLLADDREAALLTDSLPAVAWMMYTVHGNELSGSDAALQLAYHLTAGEDSATLNILDNLIVAIDPAENPDGRNRALNHSQQWSGHVPYTDAQGIPHSGTWPSARTNHYLFDLNRDWFILSQPESRARVRTLIQWHPQLVVDAHEMGSSSTFFFNPPREPLNPYIHPLLKKWWSRFSRDQARAFDRYGWSYFTEERFDEFYPGYGSSWPYYLGAISILYEQAGTGGSQVMRPEGRLLRFQEAVRHQLASSLANLETTANNRQALLQDFLRIKKDALRKTDENEPAVFLIDPGSNLSRTDNLIERLLIQGIEVDLAKEAFQVKAARNYWKPDRQKKTFPRGTYIIKTRQPLKPLIQALLAFDQRLTTQFLKEERRFLEKGRGTRMYEVSAWSLPLSFGVDAWTAPRIPHVPTRPLKQIPPRQIETPAGIPLYGYLLPYEDDSAVQALLDCFRKDYRVRVARKPFTFNGRRFLRGTLLFRLHENPDGITGHLPDIALEAGVRLFGANTALTEKGPDLGSSEFSLLETPRIALMGGSSISTGQFGSLWYLLDYELKFHHTLLSCENITRRDLRKYNVLILPSSSSYERLLGKKGLQKLHEWVNQGGTLIALESAVSFFADSSRKFSQVRCRRNVLKDLEVYKKALEREKRIGLTGIDSVALWEGAPVPAVTVKKDTLHKMSPEELKDADAFQRQFMPRGAVLRVHLDEEHWLGFGTGPWLPAYVYTSYAYLSKRPVETAARFAPADDLRLSGLLWPEARTRWEETAYLTRESLGDGQVILFTSDPFFRASYYGTRRLLINSMLLGPGMGTRRITPF